MRYFKIEKDGYILAVGNGNSGEEITKTEYNTITEVINNCPVPPNGMLYRLRTDLTWELYDAPKGGGL